MEKIIISGTGCALADFLYSDINFNSKEFLKYQSVIAGDGGLYPGKLVFREEIEKFASLPYQKILKEITADRPPVTFNIGGPGLVSLINASQILSDRDFSIRFYGGMGTDQTGRDIVDFLKKKIPLDITNYEIVSPSPTPFTDVLSDPTYQDNEGERTFINNIGAAWSYSPSHLTDDFYNSHIVCFGGTALVPRLHDNLSLLLNRAKKKNCITVVNTVFDFRNEKLSPERPWKMLNNPKDFELIDLLIMDAEEAIRISGEKELETAAEFFIRKKVSSFIITNGARNFLSYSDGRLFKERKLNCLPVSETVSYQLQNFPSSRGDTTGCGDNFAGGAIAALAMQVHQSSPGKYSFDEVLAWAVASGGLTCYYLGGTYVETTPGEKRRKIEILKDAYWKQLAF